MIMIIYKDENLIAHRLIEALEAKQEDVKDHMVFMIRCKMLLQNSGCDSNPGQQRWKSPGETNGGGMEGPEHREPHYDRQKLLPVNKGDPAVCLKQNRQGKHKKGLWMLFPTGLYIFVQEDDIIFPPV